MAYPRRSFARHAPCRTAAGLAFFILTLNLCLTSPVQAQAADRSATGSSVPVGRIITDRGPVCTGVLIGRYAVLTAAHCLVTRAGDGFFSPGLIHFALYPDDGAQLYATGAARHVAPSYPLPVSTDRRSLANDWAVLVLSEPLGDTVKPARLVTAWDGKASGWRLGVVAFGRARALRPTIRVTACALLAPDTGAGQPSLIHHDCPVEPGSSGSVLLGWRDGAIHALAVNVAVRRGAAPRTTATLVPPSVQALAGLAPRLPSFAPGTWRSPFEDRAGPAPWARDDEPPQ